MPATASEKTIDVKEAVAIAKSHLRDLFPRIPPGEIALEEVELDAERWEITLSFPKETAEQKRKGLVRPIFTGLEDRIYKKFGVHKTTGEVLFMRIRKP